MKMQNHIVVSQLLAGMDHGNLVFADFISVGLPAICCVTVAVNLVPTLLGRLRTRLSVESKTGFAPS